VRTPVVLSAVAVLLAGAGAATAQAPARPSGNFGGGALAAPPKNLFGPGNAIIALRALEKRRLEIEATVRAKCAGGDLQVATKVAADGTFAADGASTQEPVPGEKVKTTYKLAGAFTGASTAKDTVSATLVSSAEGQETQTCKTGEVKWEVRRPDGELGDREARPRAFYYGTTAQRSTGPRRPIVLRLSGDRKRISRAMFGEQVKCDDDTRSIGIEAPRTNVAVDGAGKVTDHETDRIDNGATYTYIDDHFTATLGRTGAKGTFSLSDRTVDKLTGNVLQSCQSGTIKWTAAP
jgi:hypothetical protein